MRRHGMLVCSLALFGMGIACQLYNLMIDPREPYMQQLSFMFVAMPSVLAIIHHYYYYYHEPQQHRSLVDITSHDAINNNNKRNDERDAHEENVHASPITSTPRNTAKQNQPSTAAKKKQSIQNQHNVADVSQPRRQHHSRTHSASSGFDDIDLSAYGGGDPPDKSTEFGEFQ